MKKKINYKKLIIHAGYPKTGTTFLQNQILNFDLKYNYMYLKKYNFIFDSILYDSDSIYKSKKNKISIIIKNFINNNKVNIISREGLLSPLSNIKRNFIRLRQLLKKNLKIVFVLVVRKQKDILESFYAEDFVKISNKQKEYKSYKKFISNFCSRDLDQNDQAFQIRENLNYYNIYKTIKNIFPESKIIIFDYEDIFTKRKLKEKFNKFVFKDEAIKNLNFEYENKGLKSKKIRFRNSTNTILFFRQKQIYKLFLKKILPRSLKNFIRIFLNYLSNYDEIITDNKSIKYINKHYKRGNSKLSKYIK